MIVRDQPSDLRLFLLLRGSVIDSPEPVKLRLPGTGLVDVRVRMVYRAIAFCHALLQPF